MTWTQNKNFCSVKGTVKKTKRQDRVGEKILAKHIPDKRPAFKICKELLKLNNKS